MAAADDAKPGSGLTIKVDGISSGTTGAVMVAVCSNPEEFTGKKKPYLLLSGAPEGSNACIRADAVATGTYAVKLYQDVNSNGELDRNFLGIPKEPYGFSNGVDGRPDAKLWKKASFAVTGTNDVVITVRLR
jgi:uncharacterized protein (DUF2141 family)